MNEGKEKSCATKEKGSATPTEEKDAIQEPKEGGKKTYFLPPFFLKTLSNVFGISRDDTTRTLTLYSLLLLAALASPSRDQVESIKRPSNRGDDDDEDFGEKRERMRERERERAI